MRHILTIAGLAALMGTGFAASTTPATAQVDIRLGPDRPRVIERRVIREERPRFERRRVCTIEWRHGRRIEVCRTRGPRF